MEVSKLYVLIAPTMENTAESLNLIWTVGFIVEFFENNLLIFLSVRMIAPSMKFLSLTTDNRANYIKAAKKLGFSFQSCVGHTQQLCIHEALE
jgi:hypothetical protein